MGDLYEMAHHAYEKVLNVSLLLDEIQGKIPHDRLVLYEKGETAKSAVRQALSAVYAVIAEISRRDAMHDQAYRERMERMAEEQVTFTAEALSLLAWLRQEEETLKSLAKEQE